MIFTAPQDVNKIIASFNRELFSGILQRWSNWGEIFADSAESFGLMSGFKKVSSIFEMDGQTRCIPYSRNCSWTMPLRNEIINTFAIESGWKQKALSNKALDKYISCLI